MNYVHASNVLANTKQNSLIFAVPEDRTKVDEKQLDGSITGTRTLTLEPHTACRKGGWGLEYKIKRN